MSRAMLERMKSLLESDFAEPIASGEVLGWMKSTDLEVMNVAVILTNRLWDRIRPPLDLDKETICDFLLNYYLRGIVENPPDGDWTANGHVVGHEMSAWMKVFLAFIRRICGVAESRLRVLLYCYADQDVAKLMQFWSEVTGIPTGQFTKPFVRSLTPNRSRRKMAWGLIHIRYSDARLLQLIHEWSEDCAALGAGT